MLYVNLLYFQQFFHFKKNQVRTTETNAVIDLVCSNRKAFRGIKKGQRVNFDRLSSKVDPQGFEP